MSYPIAAPPFLAQIFYQTKQGAGFSEDYWIIAAAGDYQAAMDQVTGAGGLVEIRRGMFTSSHSAIYVRISDASVKRDTIITSYTLANGAGTYAPTAGDTSPDEVALLARLTSGPPTPQFSLRPFRLIPEECVTDNAFTPTVAFTNRTIALNAWLTLHSQNVFRSAGPVYTARNIDGVAYLHMSRRKVGRPFGRSAGRSRRP
jgi:hypothetical protein